MAVDLKIPENYTPADGRDCQPLEFHERCMVCRGCEHRKGNQCGLDGQMITVKARRSANVCQAGSWPAEAMGQVAATPARIPHPIPDKPKTMVKPAAAETRATARPKVAFLTPTMGRGGAEQWIMSLCRWLEAEVTGVVTVAKDFAPEMVTGLRRLDVPLVSFPNGADQAREILRAADYILAWGIGKLGPYLEGVDTPVIWVSHGACSWTGQFIYDALEHVSHWVAVSKASRSIFPADLQDRVQIIHNGVDVDRCTPIRGRDATREAWGLRDDQIAVGYVGRFSPEKRPAAVAEAVACLPDQYVAVMIGGGWKDAETRMIAERFAPGRVIFPGHLPHVGDALAALDVWVNASPSEGMCLSMIEAWLASVPCVSTRTGAIPELEEAYGQLVWPIPIGAAGSSIARIIETCMEQEEHARMIPEARGAAWNEFTSPAMAARWDEYLRSLRKPATVATVANAPAGPFVIPESVILRTW